MKTRDKILIGAGIGAGLYVLSKAFGSSASAGGLVLGNNLNAKLDDVAGQIDPATFRAVVHPEAGPYIDAILAAARATGVNPFLIEAIGWRESRWGTTSSLDRPGPAGRGDAGHGHGLMQIDDRTWGAWLSSNDWTDPYVNIRKGAEILKSNYAFFTAAPGAAVSLNAKQAAARGIDFATAGGDVTDSKSTITFPDPRPLSGDALTAATAAAYNTGPLNVLRSVASGASPDTTTASSASSRGRGDYSHDVLSTANASATRADALAMSADTFEPGGGDTGGAGAERD